MKHRALHAIFFCSGVSGLVYQVVWVRQFANVFGSTVYSAAAVTAVFMSGLGLGGLLGGRWADRLHARRRSLPLAMYGRLELAIAALAGALALLLPHLEGLSASISTYAPGEHGWLEISLGSSVVRCSVAVVLLAPVTTLMGATLTLLIRHVVGTDLGSAGWRIGLLYAVNTAGAALGCLLTDLVFVPTVGLLATQGIAVSLNLVAAVGAAWLARATSHEAGEEAPRDEPRAIFRPIAALAAALFLMGFVGMGFEILWFRHLMSVIGPFRYVFSLMLAVILVGLWVGSLLAGLLDRRFGKPIALLALAQVLLVITSLGALVLLTRADFFASLESIHRWADGTSELVQSLASYWALAKPILLCCALPSVLMGTAFPLANAHAQRVAALVGARAGALYLASTAGAVVGSLVVGVGLLPTIGTQRTAFVVAACSVASLVPLMLATARAPLAGTRRLVLIAGAVGIGALALFGRAPADRLRLQVIPEPPAGTRLLSVSEGIGETIGILESPKERMLFTNGHSMSATSIGNQRYMRLFAHLPLLLLDKPRDVAIICFGVGNTLSAVVLHDEIERADMIDVSRNVLGQADFFRATNHGALENPKVHVHVNDGRQHLRMKPPASYDLITLEPPPLAHAGVASLYSRDFYELARTRLRAGGMITQWLPLGQLTADLNAALVRAFVDVFPTSVLLAGSPPELILLGVKGDELVVDPAKLEAKLEARPAVREELRTIFVDGPLDLLGTYVASSSTLKRLTARARPVTDDFPITEYQPPRAQQRPGGILNVFHVRDAPAWCPRCFDGTGPASVAHLGAYLEVMDRLYASGVFWNRKPTQVTISAKGREAVAESRYLRQWLGVP